MTRQIWRQVIPIDDRTHTFEICGPILHVAARGPYSVEMWHEHEHLEDVSTTRYFRVFGTGQPLPDAAEHHVGTALAGPMVWHLYEMASPL